MRENRTSGLRRGEAAATLPLSYSTSLPATLMLAALTLPVDVAATDPAIEGYSDFAALSNQVADLARPDLCQVGSSVKSPGEWEIWPVTLSRGKAG